MALKLSGGEVKILTHDNKENYYNEKMACVECSISFDDLEPRYFSFNSPFGACEKCDGLGNNMKIDPDHIITDVNKSIMGGCLAPVGEPPWHNRFDQNIHKLSKSYNFDLNEHF